MPLAFGWLRHCLFLVPLLVVIALLLIPVSHSMSTWRIPHSFWSVAIAASMVVLIAVVSPLWQDAIEGTIAKPDLSREYKPRFWIDGELCRDGSFWRTHQE